MTIQEIENLSLAELKQQQKELTEQLKGVGIAELAGRYLQARIDAKMRDDKLSEQGKNISLMQDGMAAAKSQIELLQSNLSDKTAELATFKQQANDLFEKCKAEHRDHCESTAKTHADTCAEHDKTIAELKEQLETALAECAQQKLRGDRLRTQAVRNNSAINQAATYLNDAIAKQQVANADEV